MDLNLDNYSNIDIINFTSFTNQRKIYITRIEDKYLRSC